MTYASKIDKAEARLDFTADATMVERQVRAFNPVPGAFVEIAGERVKLLAVQIMPAVAAAPGTVLDNQLTIACAQGAVRPTLIQRAGRGAMTAADALRGFTIPAGTQL